MATVITPSSMPLPARWVVIEGDLITDVTGQSFIIDGKEYPQSLFIYPDEAELKNIGLYKVIDEFPVCGIFERMKGQRYVNIDHALREVTLEYDVVRFTDQEISGSFNVIIMMHLNSFAMTRGYESMLSACTYINSGVDRFRNDAEYCVRLRDETWQTAFSLLERILSGDLPMPSSTDDITSMLPKGRWPDEQ